ncbi:MAG: secretin N-terminal domain-containing protein, partial [Campylobacterota bacterium]|nr:secretin N-terminal domain-containing protein [Campylobacterota bacterium]
GKKKNVAYLVKYLQNIDKKGSLIEQVVDVVYLKNAESKSVVKILNGIITTKYTKDKIKSKPFVSIDEESNSIILMGAKDEISYFNKLITKLDVERMQVYVTAKIMEVSQLGIRNVGIRYGLNAGRATNSGIFTMAAELGGMSGSNLILPSGFDLDFGTPTSSTTTVDGVTTTTQGNSKFTEALALGTTLNLLENNDALEIISEPSILCINNKESSIYIGTTKSIQMGSSTDKNGNATPKLERADIGLSLKVKPRISNQNKVILDIFTKIEDVSSKQTNSQPDANKKELITSAIVSTGEAVILGGYTKYKKQNIVDKVPFLGDLPIIGNLFRNTVDGKDKINLVIVVTPYIVPKSKDLTYIRNQLTQLKLLEDKYTKDTILRLEESKLKYKIEDIKREDNLKELEEEIKEIEDKPTLEKSQKLTNKELHDKRINDIFGI